MLNSGPSRRRGWILRCRQLEPGVSRAPYALWDPIFGHVAPEKFKIQLFRPASGLSRTHNVALVAG